MSFEEFLRETLPHLGLKTASFKKKGIKRRVVKRMKTLHIATFQEYREVLEKNGEEQRELYRIFTITISRFLRDAPLFEGIKKEIFPLFLKKEKGEHRIWSVGCSCGEEPYSIRMLWEEFLRERGEDREQKIMIYGTDVNETCLKKAKKGEYKRSSLEEVQEEIISRYFIMKGGLYIIKESVRDSIEFLNHNIILDDPIEGVDMIFCRNSVFTYLTEKYQKKVLERIHSSLLENGFLVLGSKERLPRGSEDMFAPMRECMYKRLDSVR